MKNKFLVVCSAVLLFSCSNNRSTERTDTTDTTEADMNGASANSSNNTTNDTSNNVANNSSSTLTTDEATSSFMMKAADGGMTEVELGKLAQGKAKNQSVKDFGSMMVRDHSTANDKMKTLASQRNVKLPDSMSTAHTNKKNELTKKDGAAFDKAYMDAMVKDHQEVISLFEKAADNSKDNDVKNFINNTLPTIRQHLDSAKSIRKRL